MNVGGGRAIAWRKLRFRFDWTLTLAGAVVTCFGLMNLWSAVHDRQSNLFSQQISWLGLGVGVFLAVATLDYPTNLPVRLHPPRRRRDPAARRARFRQDGGGRTPMVRSRALPRPAVRAHAAPDRDSAREVPQRLAGTRGSFMAKPGHPGGHCQPADPAHRQAARLRHGLPAVARLLHRPDDRAPASQDRALHRGPGHRGRLPDLSALPPTSISASASKPSSTRTRKAPTRPGRPSTPSVQAGSPAKASCTGRRSASAISPPCGPTSRSPYGPKSGGSSAVSFADRLPGPDSFRSSRLPATPAIASAPACALAWRRCSFGTCSSTWGW